MNASATAPVIAGLAAGIGLIIVIGITFSVQTVLFIMTRTYGNEGYEEEHGIKTVTIYQKELADKYSTLDSAKQNVDRIMSSGAVFPSPYETRITLADAGLLKSRLPFAEETPDTTPFADPHYIIIEVVSENPEDDNRRSLYLVGLYYPLSFF